MDAHARAHALPPAEILDRHGVTSEQGLTEIEATERLQRYGTNAVVSRPSVSTLTVLLHQLNSPIFFLLLTAGGLGLVFGEHAEAVAIGATGTRDWWSSRCNC